VTGGGSDLLGVRGVQAAVRTCRMEVRGHVGLLVAALMCVDYALTMQRD
jgi:hypothetical protein